MFSRIFKAIAKRLSYPSTYLAHIRFRKNVRTRFSELKSNVDQFDKCLIIANGPSVNNVDFSKYRDHKIITMNRAYVKWDELLGKPPFMHVCINQLVLSEFLEDLSSLDCPCFYNFSVISKKALFTNENIIPILMGFGIGDRVARDINKPFSSGGTVTFVALNLAILLGFKDIRIVGLDHSFVSEGKKNETVTMMGVDENHFFGSYFPKGMRWELPDLERSERGYRTIKAYADKNNITVINESTYTQCTVFPVM